jgi:hypothetical protein
VKSCDFEKSTRDIAKDVSVVLVMHDIEAMLDLPTTTPKAKRCYLRQGWLHTNTTDYFLGVLLNQRCYADIAKSSCVYVHPSTAVIYEDKEIRPFAIVSNCCNSIKACVNNARRAGCPDDVISAVFLMVLDGLHYRLLTIFTTRGGEMHFGLLDGLGNDCPGWAPLVAANFVRELNNSENSFTATSKIINFDKSKTFQQSNFKDCGIVACDMLKYLLAITTTDLIADSGLQAKSLELHVYSCFESAVREDRWSKGNAETRRLEFSRWLLEKATLYPQASPPLLHAIRQTLALDRPKEQVKTLLAALQRRGLHRTYSVMPMKDVFVQRKAKGDAPAVLELDKGKLMGFAMNPDYR